MSIKKLFFIAIAATTSVLFLPVYTQDRDDNCLPVVEIQAHGKAYSIYAEGRGIGPSLEYAKLMAINNVISQLVYQMKDIPGVSHRTMLSQNDDTTGDGVDEIVGKTRIAGSWHLKDSIYNYTIVFMLQGETAIDEDQRNLLYNKFKE